MRTLEGLKEANSTAFSMRGLYEIGPLDPSMPQEAVMMARGRAASMRCARAAGAKPPKTAAWMAPSRVIARQAISAAGIIGTGVQLEWA